MKSTVGRPRKLSDAQVEAILEWHATRKTMKQVAADYGVSPSTIENVIKRSGAFKQASREKRGEALAERQRCISRLREDGWI